MNYFKFCALTLSGITFVVIYIAWSKGYTDRHRRLIFAYFFEEQIDEVNCKRNVPCLYPEEVDLRIIVITYNRPKSLQKLLDSLQDLQLDGDTARLEIWVDVNKENKVHNETLMTAKNFTWKQGLKRVHIQESNAGIMGQWIDTWTPYNSSREIPLILEDDLSVSIQAYRYLKAAHAAYKNRSDFAGVTITSEYPSAHDGGKPLFGFKNQTAFMYICIGTWGYSPSPQVWYRFQKWFHQHVNKKDFHPYVPSAHTATSWYKGFEARGTQSSMWEMWFVYFSNMVEKRFTVYPNHFHMNSDGKSCIGINRREIGLHYHSKGNENICKLLTTWKNEYGVMPKYPHMFDWKGNRVDNYTII